VAQQLRNSQNETCKVWIPVSKGEKVSGIVSIPDTYQPSKTVGVILAHGSANDMNNPLMAAIISLKCSNQPTFPRNRFMTKL
jgi:hypothetical protein